MVEKLAVLVHNYSDGLHLIRYTCKTLEIDICGFCFIIV